MIADRYLTAEEFEEALSDVGHAKVGSIEGSELGTPRQQITRIELDLSDGRTLEITCDLDLDHRPEILISEIQRRR